MNNSDLSSIREQLLAFQNGAQPDPENSEPVWEKSRSPSLPFPGGEGIPARQPHQAEIVQALRQRSPQTGRQPTPEEMAAAGGTIPTSVNNYLRRLYEEAEKINDLYRQQEIAIQKFQRTVKGLDIILLRQGHGAALKSEQFCELRDAALTTVVQDETGRYILTAVSLDLNVDEQQAFQDAAEIRSFGRSRSPQSPEQRGLFEAIFAEPMAALESVWQSLTGTLEERTQITPLDILVWCGGGVIGRKALNLLLAATPGLGYWILGIIVAAVVLGLYRLLFTQRTDLAFIARLFLALVGLGIGGQI